MLNLLNNIDLKVRCFVITRKTDVFFIDVDPQIGYTISHKEEFKTSLLSFTNDIESESIDWVINGGIGVRSNSGVSLSVRYHYDFGKVYDNSNTYNNLLQFSVSIDFL